MSASEELAIEDKVAIERAHFRHNLRMLASQPDFVRYASMGIHLKHSLHIGEFMPHGYAGRLLPLDEIFTTVYGPKGAAAFWHAECSLFRTLKATSLLFWLTLDPRGIGQQAYSGSFANAVLKARQMGETWIIADEIAFQDVRHGWQLPANRVQIDVEKAARWLLSKPPLEHLVPASLASALVSGSLEPASAPPLPQTIEGSVVTQQPALVDQSTTHRSGECGRRGPRAIATTKAAASMLADLRAGKLTKADLAGGVKQESLAAAYQVSRDTMRKHAAALCRSLSEFLTPTISANRQLATHPVRPEGCS